MKKEELILLLKEYRENNAKLKLRKKDRKRLEKELNELAVEVSFSSGYGVNNDIHSQNKVSDKVSSLVIRNDSRRLELQQKLKNIDAEIERLQDKVDEAEIRLKSLYYKEREILTAYYVDNRTAEEIGRNLYFELYQRTCTQENIYRIIEKGTNRLLRL